jgi:hypothetical protein
MILGPSWTVIPFYKSRFFTYNPALDDNFVIADDELDVFIREITGEIKPQRFPYRRSWSIGGELYPEFDRSICEDWQRKIFGQHAPPQTLPYLFTKMTLNVYDIRCNQLYANLLQQSYEDLKVEAAKGEITQIGDHHIVRNGVREDFDHCLSTVPLNVLCKLMNANIQLPAKDLHYLHVETEDLDFEGYNQALVVDEIFDFFKVTNVAPNRYLFYCHKDIQNPGVYLMSVMQKFEILDGTSITDALPMGPIPKLDAVEQYGIYCVGSYAQWDWCMDIGSCILRILRYTNRGNKPTSFKTLE